MMLGRLAGWTPAPLTAGSVSAFPAFTVRVLPWACAVLLHLRPRRFLVGSHSSPCRSWALGSRLPGRQGLNPGAAGGPKAWAPACGPALSLLKIPSEASTQVRGFHTWNHVC